MLWFDNRDDCSLVEKLERAAAHYERRFHTRPTLCIVHPMMVVGSPDVMPGLEIRRSNDVLPNHFWLGLKETHRSAA
ncbi:MAG: hypothetical protein ACFB51_21760 [Anaerolineae bacterium]